MFWERQVACSSRLICPVWFLLGQSQFHRLVLLSCFNVSFWEHLFILTSALKRITASYPKRQESWRLLPSEMKGWETGTLNKGGGVNGCLKWWRTNITRHPHTSSCFSWNHGRRGCRCPGEEKSRKWMKSVSSRRGGWAKSCEGGSRSLGCMVAHEGRHAEHGEKTPAKGVMGFSSHVTLSQTPKWWHPGIQMHPDVHRENDADFLVARGGAVTPRERWRTTC